VNVEQVHRIALAPAVVEELIIDAWAAKARKRLIRAYAGRSD
jgi:hypothetical protein